MKKRFTIQDAIIAKIILKSRHPVSLLLEGMNIELEHQDITNGDPIISAKIALAHLKENSDYYKKLKKIGL